MAQFDLPFRPSDDPPWFPTPITIRVAPTTGPDALGVRKWRAWIVDSPDVCGHGGSPDATIGHVVRLQAGRLGVTIEETS